MLTVIKPYFWTVPTAKQEQWIDTTLSSYFYASEKNRDNCSEMHVLEHMTELLNEISSYKLYGSEEAYLHLIYENRDEEYEDFELVSSEWFEGYIFDIMAVLEQNKISYYSEYLDEHKNLPFVEVW